MKIHQDWTAAGFSLTPVAHAIGPFGYQGFLSAVWNIWNDDEIELSIAESASALIPLTVSKGTLRFVGHRDLVDYRSPLGRGADELMRDVVDSLPAGMGIHLDSLPEEAVAPLVDGLRMLGLEVTPVVHHTAAVLTLPATFDDYLMSIAKKERHELRRKRRRYETEVGSLELCRATGDGEVFDRFVELHRRSEGEKGSFMSDHMERYFRMLIDLPGWEIDALLTDSGDMTAAAFGFADDDGYFLYNSAFNPDLRHLSPGQVMLGALIERAIAEQRTVFDFLKGDEPYKFRFGAVERPLYEIVTAR